MGHDFYPSVEVDLNGNLYVAYFSAGTISGGTATGTGVDIIVLKLDTNGNVLWQRQNNSFNTSSSDATTSPKISIDGNGNAYIAYYSNGTVSGGTQTGVGTNDIIVFKLDSNGNTIWQKQNNTFNTTNSDVFPSIAVDLAGNSYITYHSNGIVTGGTQTGAGTNDIIVFKMDTNGNVLWQKQNSTFNTTFADTNPSISIDTNGNSYVSYYSSGTVSGGTNTGGNADVIIFKLDANGNTLWQKQDNTFNSTGTVINPVLTVSLTNNIYLSYIGASENLVKIFKFVPNIASAFRSAGYYV